MKAMNKKLLLGVAAGCAMGLTAGAWAADAATADEVVAKVNTAATEVKAQADVALTEFDKKDGKWAWKDTYVFVLDCTNGIMKAHPNEKVKGMKLADPKDKATEKEFGSAPVSYTHLDVYKRQRPDWPSPEVSARPPAPAVRRP